LEAKSLIGRFIHQILIHCQNKKKKPGKPRFFVKDSRLIKTVNTESKLSEKTAKKIPVLGIFESFKLFRGPFLTYFDFLPEH